MFWLICFHSTLEIIIDWRSRIQLVADDSDARGWGSLAAVLKGVDMLFTGKTRLWALKEKVEELRKYYISPADKTLFSKRQVHPKRQRNEIDNVIFCFVLFLIATKTGITIFR